MGVEPTPVRTPLLSFIVPVHGVQAYLRDCLDSILAEAGDEVEVVAVDDASPDRCGELLDSYQRTEPRLQTLHLPANVGPGQARNAGLEQATGAYVWFVDPDDYLPAGALPAVRARLVSSSPDVLVIDHAEVFPDGRLGHWRPPGVPATSDGPVRLREQPHLLRLAPSACTKIFRRGLIDDLKLRFPSGLYEDGVFSRTMLLAAERIEVLDRICYHYRQRRSSSRTRSVSPRHFDVFDQYERLFDCFADADADSGLLRELFRVMIDHYLVIIGNERRVPPRMRRDFFRRMAADFRTRMPPGGYEVPDGLGRLKHWLVRRDAYAAYATLRLSYRAARSPLRALRWIARRSYPVQARGGDAASLRRR